MLVLVYDAVLVMGGDLCAKGKHIFVYMMPSAFPALYNSGTDIISIFLYLSYIQIIFPTYGTKHCESDLTTETGHEITACRLTLAVSLI